MHQPPLPLPLQDLDEACVRLIADYIPRGSSVAMLDRQDELARILTSEKGCSVNGDAAASVLVALSDAQLRGSAFAQRARHASLAVVLIEQSQPDFGATGWRVVERRSLSTLRSIVREAPSLRKLAAAARCWPFDPLAPKRWLLYRMHRMLASAERLEKLARLAVSAQPDLAIDPRQILLLGRSA